MLIFFMKEGWGRKKIFFVNPNDYKAEWYQVHDLLKIKFTRHQF